MEHQEMHPSGPERARVTRPATDGARFQACPPRRAVHPLMSLQQAAGNTAVTQLVARSVQRAPKPGTSTASTGSSTPGKRVVFLDNDVIGEIGDGNLALAEALLALRISGAELRMSRYNFAEAGQGPAVGSGTRRLIIRELGIIVDEGGGLSSRIETYADAASRGVAIQPKDVPVLAAVRAAGAHAEIWSLDGGVKQNAALLGVRLAPESRLPLTRVTTRNNRAGLDNVGLDAWDIGADGIAVLRSSPPGTVSGPTPQGKNPAATGPAATGTQIGSGPRRPIASGGGTRVGASEAATIAGGLLTAGIMLTTPAIKRWFAERYLKEKWKAEERAMVEQAIVARSADYNKLIGSRRNAIAAARSRSESVVLHVVVDSEWTDTDLGPAQTKATVSYFTLLFPGDIPLEWPLFQPKQSKTGAFFHTATRSRRRQVFSLPL